MQKVKEKIKKIASLTVAFAIFWGMTVSAGSFTDVDYNQQYAVAVDALTELGIMYGDANGSFRPDDALTRAEVTAVIVRTLNMENVAEKNRDASMFSDVSADHWATGYINVAYGYGFVSGYGDGTFRPDELVTYEQIVKMLVAILGYAPMADNMGGYPTGYLMIASQKGITKGASGLAGEAADRKTVAQLVYNALDVDIMVQSGFSSSSPEYQVIEGRTLRTEFLKEN